MNLRVAITQLADDLYDRVPCEEAREWLEDYEDPYEAWDDCTFGSWLIWAAEMVGVMPSSVWLSTHILLPALRLAVQDTYLALESCPQDKHLLDVLNELTVLLADLQEMPTDDSRRNDADHYAHHDRVISPMLLSLDQCDGVSDAIDMLQALLDLFVRDADVNRHSTAADVIEEACREHGFLYEDYLADRFREVWPCPPPRLLELIHEVREGDA